MNQQEITSPELDDGRYLRLLADFDTFSPDLHEAIGSVSSNEYPPGVVAQEARRGYRQGEGVLRPARVLVSG